MSRGLVLASTAAILAAVIASCGGGDPIQFPPPDPTGGGGAGAGMADAGAPDAADGSDADLGCDDCTGETPICVDDDHCAAACPNGRDACNASADPADPTICCAGGMQCCLAADHGYAGPDLCRPAGEPCPNACPDGTTFCEIGEFCQINLETSAYQCVGECAPDSLCFGQLCCPLGTACTNGGCPLPDLTIDVDDLAASVEISDEVFSQDSCSIFEGCIGGPGQRTLLRFDLKTPNIGEGNLHLGFPEGNPLFVFSSCHEHYHFEGYANYRLLDANMQVAASGHKQAFCLLDLDQVDPSANPDPVYDCGYQGIQAGWADVYNKALTCQWVDITGVPAGDYLLEVTVNGAHQLAESSYTNNSVTVPVTIATSSCPGGCRAVDEVCCAAGDPCGWAADGSCDCANFFGWDGVDCGACLDTSQACSLGNSCPAGCTANTGACCADGDPCALAGNGACDCAGAYPWDMADCGSCAAPGDPDCPVNSCPNGCTPADPGNFCCGDANPCNWANDGYCDCGGAPWDTVDCASCTSSDPNCP
jgi:Lysyl oxidase